MSHKCSAKQNGDEASLRASHLHQLMAHASHGSKTKQLSTIPRPDDPKTRRSRHTSASTCEGCIPPIGAAKAGGIRDRRRQGAGDGGLAWESRQSLEATNGLPRFDITQAVSNICKHVQSNISNICKGTLNVQHDTEVTQMIDVHHGISKWF